MLILVHGKFQEIIHVRLADPVPPPLDPGCHFDMMCGCVDVKNTQTDERACWVSGGGGTHLGINNKIVN